MYMLIFSQYSGKSSMILFCLPSQNVRMNRNVKKNRMIFFNVAVLLVRSYRIGFP